MLYRTDARTPAALGTLPFLVHRHRSSTRRLDESVLDHRVGDRVSAAAGPRRVNETSGLRTGWEDDLLLILEHSSIFHRITPLLQISFEGHLHHRRQARRNFEVPTIPLQSGLQTVWDRNARASHTRSLHQVV